MSQCENCNNSNLLNGYYKCDTLHYIVTDLENNLESYIIIYDRFGKIITKIKPYEKGWDGYNSNGDKLPSSDYWFLVKYNKNNVLREFRANFSLLRR